MDWMGVVGAACTGSICLNEICAVVSNFSIFFFHCGRCVLSQLENLKSIEHQHLQSTSAILLMVRK